MLWRLIIIVVIFYLILRLLGALSPPRQGRSSPGGPEAPGAKNASGGRELVRDALTGIYFAKEEALVVNLRGETLYFASRETRDQYLREQSPTYH